MEFNRIQHSLKVRRDAGATVLLGPLRLLAIMAGTLFLLRVVLARAGLEVVGLWSLLNIMAAFISLLDIGFSQLLARNMHASDAPPATVIHLQDKQAIELFYRLLFWGLALPILLALGWFIPAIPYERMRFLLAVALMAGSAGAQLRCRLEAAVLAAHQRNAHVQIINTLGIFVFLATAIAGACLDAPLEGAALGAFLSAHWIRRRLRRQVATLHPAANTARLRLAESLPRVAVLARTGLHFYALSLGAVLREPCFRLVIGSLLGAKALGAYTISFRLSTATRDLVAGGFTVLYPSLASLHRAGSQHDIAGLQTASLVFLVALGSAALGCLYGFVEPLFNLLLGSIPEGIVMSVRILVLWNLITLFNVPFDLCLQATGHEWASAASLWVHTLAILLLWPASFFLNMDLRFLLFYWTAASLATQLIIFHQAQKKLNGFWPVVLTRPVAGTLLLALAYWGVVLGWTAHIQAPAGSWAQASRLALVLVPASLAFIGLAFANAHKVFKPFWRTA